MDRSSSISLLRQLYRELRPTLSMGQKHVYDCSHWKYIISMAKKDHTSKLNQEQLKKLCSLGENYLTYLRSTRQYIEIMTKYKGVGERSITDTAHIVGLNMPHEDKIIRKPKCSKSVESTSSGQSA